MVKHVLYFALMAWTFVALSRLLPGFRVDGWVPAIIASIVLAIVNTVIKPVLFVLTLPFTILTLGVFLLVLNMLMVWLTAVLVPGFRVDGLGTLFLSSLALTLVGMLWKALSRTE